MIGQIIPFKDQLTDEFAELQIRPDLANEEIELLFVQTDCGTNQDEIARIKVHWETVIVIAQTLGKVVTEFESRLNSKKAEENDD